MINITNENNSVIFYIDDEQVLAFPLNKLSVLTEEVSDIVMFKTAKNFKTVVQERWEEITINGEPITKENIVDKFNEIANTNEGGAKINAGTNITLQEEADGSITISATGELGGTVAWADVTDKPSTFTPSAHNHVVTDITDLQGKLDEKANVSDIPNLDGYATEEWVNSQGYLTEHQDISQLATKSELATKQDTLVSGTNIKTINGQDILGEGNIEIQGGTGDVTKQYVDEQLALKVDKTVYEADKATFALKSEIPSIEGLASKEELKNGLDGKQDKGDYALKSELPDISGLATKAEVDETYAKKTDIPDTSDFATKEELASKADASALASKQDTLISGTNIKTINGQTVLGEGNIEIQGGGSGIADAPSDGKLYGRKNTNWSEIIIPSTDNFATKSEIADMLTKTEASSTYQPIGDYLTEIPSEYVTDEELNAKGYKKIEYLTQSQYDELVEKEEGVMYVITDAPEVVIPDTSTFATKEEIADMATKTWVTSQGYLTEHQDISNLATKQEVTEGLSAKQDKGNYITVETADGKYQVKGDYATKAELANKVDNSTYTEDKATFALKSELTDFITVSVDNLVNYYKKSETYTKGEVDGKISAITTINFEVVAELPESGEANKIYLVPNAEQGEQNVKDEYIWVDGKWEIIGSTKVDLSNYYNKGEVDSKLSAKVDLSTYTSDKATFALKSELTNLATKEELNGKVDDAEIADMLTKTEAASTYQPKGEYATTSQLATKQDTLVSGTNIKTVNGNSLLGEGNIEIQGGNTEPKFWYTLNSENFYNNAKIGDFIYLSVPLTNLIIQEIRNGYEDQGTSGRNKIYTCSYYIDSYTKGREKVTAYQFIVLESDYSVTTVEIKLATQNDLSTKQNTLVSGESIKTINGESILGSGNIVIEGGTGDVTKQYVDEQLALKADKTEIADMLTKTEASTTYKTIASEWFGTQSEYDLITEKDPNVTYFITEG